jgi:tape measure domain-containing protein
MAVNPTVLEIKAKISGLKGLNQLKSSLRKLGTESVNAENTLKGYTAEIAKFAQKTGNSINSLEAQKKAFEALRRSVDVTGDEFKQAGIELEKLDKKLAKAEGRKQGGGRLRGAAQIAGTVAGAGVFGGPEGAIGSLAGAAFGGPAGAIVGGAIGAQVGGIRKALGATAEYAANLKKLRIALLGVTTSNEEYARSLQAIEQGTKDYAIPQEILTKQFTKLQASVQGAGGNLDDTKTAFNGIVAAVRATGGSLQDVNSALTATAQVFSKGKVSAEELRQQIGERLPGAFSLFAESIGKTPQELDKALEGGKVSLQDFQTFAKALLERYGENAKIIASGPESAGDRLKVSLGKLSESVGTLLAPIGTAFLKTFEEIVKAISLASNALVNFLGIGTQGAINKAEREFKSATEAFAASGIDYRQAKLDPKSLSRDERRKFNRLSNRLSLTKRRLDEARAAGAVVEIQRPDEGTGLPGIDLTTKTPTGGGKGRTPADKTPAALEKLRRLMTKVSREFVDVGTEATKVGADARTRILLEREQAYQKVLQQDQDRILIIKQVSAVTGAAYEDEIAKLDKLKQARISLINQQVDEQLFAQRLSSLGLNQQSFDQNGRAITGLDQQAFPTGVDSILNPGKITVAIQELKKGLEELTNPANQVIGAATAIGTAFSDSFKSVIDGSATTQEALAGFFKNIASYFLDMAVQIIQKMITMAILNQVVGLLPGLNGGGGYGGLSNGSFFGGGGGALDFSSNFGLNLLNANGNAFDKGLVTSPTVFAYANGGTGRFGLMGEAGPEAIMPLSRGPNGKLGVQASGGGGVSVGNINITVENTGDQLNPAAQKQLAGQVQGIVLSTLANERRSGGML